LNAVNKFDDEFDGDGATVISPGINSSSPDMLYTTAIQPTNQNQTTKIKQAHVREGTREGNNNNNNNNNK
jgi:hypothetical protein